MKKQLGNTFLLSALLCCVLAAASCGGDGTGGAETGTVPVGGETDVTAETEEMDALAARMNVDDGLETVDYEGRTFRIIGDDACEDYYIQDEETGDSLDDAVYARNLAVTDRFNIVLEAAVFVESDMVTKLKNSVMAGDDEYQLFAGHIIYAGAAVCDGLYYNWYEVPHIDFSKPWWSDSNIEDLTYDGKAFIAMGDFALTTIDSTYCVYYNKELAANYDLPDLYALVNDGKWTLDKLTEISKDVYRDVNGDSKAGSEDLYGFAIWARSPINTFLWSFGEKLGKKQDDGTVVLDYYNDKVVEIYQKLNDFSWNSEGVYLDTVSVSGTNTDNVAMEMFTNNQVLFMPNTFLVATTALRDFTTDYGIIPYPKWDEAQEGYYTMVDGGHEGMAIPVSVSDVDFVGTIVEALNAESYKRTVPVFYDIVLKTKGSRDEESVAMLDMIFAGRVFDFGYVYGEFGAAFWVQNLIEKKSADIASYYEKNHKSYDIRIADAIEFFEEYETP
ncbi:MAG: hypothetical protein IJ449_03895 [Clostridia bacterium]|nr:hypothetical protein [Clostridia bacterium]